MTATATAAAAAPPAADPAPARAFLRFVDAAPTPFHAVAQLRARFAAAGFTELHERDDWSAKCQAGGKYYVTRNASTIAAFAVGAQWKPGNPVAIVGTHTDSCCLRIKPISKAVADGYLQVGCECYGGGLWHTWFDRDLGVAGRVMIRTGDGEIQPRLVKIDQPILRIPTLAIHLHRQEEFSFSKESQLYPIAGLVAAALNSTQADTAALADAHEADFQPLAAPTERHHTRLVEQLAEAASVAAADVVDFECVLFDTQPSSVGGLHNELIFAPRLDNLEMTWCAAEGLVAATQAEQALAHEPGIRLVAAFDNEEVGSTTTQGANSSFLPALLQRLGTVGHAASTAAGGPAAAPYEQSLARAFLVSADMAHAVHPNYASKHEARHKPQMNGGTTIKINANARYTTNSPGVALLQEAARRARVPLQLFVTNQDSPCGSTIGPMLAAKLGSRAVDVGNAQLSMHSIRETGGVLDVDYGTRLFASFFEHYAELEQKIRGD